MKTPHTDEQKMQKRLLSLLRQTYTLQLEAMETGMMTNGKDVREIQRLIRKAFRSRLSDFTIEKFKCEWQAAVDQGKSIFKASSK